MFTECPSNALRGIESLQKHLKTHNAGSEALQAFGNSMTWIPVPWHQSLASGLGSTTDLEKSSCFVASHIPRLNPGAVLVSSMKAQKSQKLVQLMQESAKHWLLSQPIMSQAQDHMGSQSGLHLVTKRKRGAKQLEMMEIKRNDEDDDEGTTKITLDNLTRFIGDQRFNFMDQRQKTLTKSFGPEEGSKDIQMVVGQGMKVLMVDLSRPQPMRELIRDGGDCPESAKAPKCITFEVVRRKMDKLSAASLVETDRLLHDLSL